jgi:hypothetical protein
MAKAVGEGKVTCIVHATSAEVEAHSCEAGTCQPLGKRGEHPPVLEPFEAVQNGHSRPGF